MLLIFLICRLHNMETTMLSLATLPRAPPAALYNPLEHGHHLSDNQVASIIARSLSLSLSLSYTNLITFNNL